jgi:transketolase
MNQTKINKISEIPISVTPMKNGFGKGLSEIGDKYNNLIALGSDITNSVGMNFFKDKFPDRFFSLGIAEQNTAAVAAGLALSGKIPVFSTYAVFSAMRATDQIRISLCYNKLHCIIGGAHAGISVGPDGATHQALEDIAIMRSLPNMTVLSPCDENQTKLATIAAVTQLNSPVYIRYGREPVPNFTSTDDEFIIGKAQVLQEGKDISIIATGTMVWTALLVAKELQKSGFSADVINIHTIKPIDKNTIIKSAKKTGKAITLEEHQIHGGFGSAVAEVIIQNHPVKMKIIGMPDSFGESGNPKELLEKYHLDQKSILQNCLNFLNE